MEQSEVTFRDVISPFSFSPSSVTGSPVSISPSLSVTDLSIPLPFLHSSAIFLYHSVSADDCSTF
ncbi:MULTISPECIES: hypothetical protein [unclassified Wolbachia]|uniref:hypothetical protein n=1 Tax=unclassified Wolbachia TaxID=2640676 RepID=UPI001FEB11AF|nr:hypothetical protein [Wolbachia endosymbiont of Leptopilina clavipes]